MDINKLLEEAKRRYPSKTKFKCLYSEGISRTANNYKIHHSDTGGWRLVITNGNNGFMYMDGKWAETVFTPHKIYELWT